MARLYRRNGRYGLDYFDHKGRRIRRLVSADRSVAVGLLADAIRTVERRRAGLLLVDPDLIDEPIQSHVDGYEEELKRRARAPMYIYIIKRRLEAAAFDQDWTTLRDCTAASVAAFLNGLADNNRSPRTRNQHRADLSAFFGWCVRRGALPANPCDAIRKTTVKLDEKRRALSIAECRRLLAAAPPERAFVYRVLLLTGLRRGEAAQVRWGDLRLDVTNPYVELPAAITKSGRAESVPLVADLAALLRQRRQGARDRERLFDSIPTMTKFRLDLKAADIEEEDARGRRVVLHSLRHSLATMLAGSGVPAATAMQIMRHKDVRLTLMTYTDEGLLSSSAAMAALPTLEAVAAIDERVRGFGSN